MLRSSWTRLSQLVVLVTTLACGGVAWAQTTEGGASLSVEVQIGSPRPGAQGSRLAEHLSALASQDANVRLAAIRALGELGDPAAVAPLASLARTDEHAEIRGWALRALHRIGTTEALDAVRAIGAADQDERVRTLVAQLVGPLAPPPEVAQAAPPPPPSAPAQAAPVEAAPVEVAPVPEPFAQAPEAQAGVYIQAGAAPAGQPVMMPQAAPMMYDRAQLIEMRRLRRAGLGLRIGGWTLFGITYFTSFMAGIGISMDDDDDGWPLMIPLVGPVIMGARILREGEGALGVLSVVWGFLEMAGLGMAIAGHVRRRRARRAAPGYGDATPGRQVAFIPAGPADGPGLALAATF